MKKTFFSTPSTTGMMASLLEEAGLTVGQKSEMHISRRIAKKV